jgi:hypothetical protein
MFKNKFMVNIFGFRRDEVMENGKEFIKIDT